MSQAAFRDLVGFLESYRGHDAAIRLGTYIAMFLGGSSPTPVANKLRTVAREFSACRVILRLFDDATMWAVSLGYGLGKSERSGAVRILELISNVVNTLYYPVEHLAWCGNKELLPLPGALTPLLGLGGLALWAIALIAGILKSLLRLSILQKDMAKVKRQRHLEKSEPAAEATEQNQSIQAELRRLAGEQKAQVILLVQNAADLMNAINWFPPGLLWSGKLSPRTSGFCGLISTLMMCVRYWPKKAKAS